MSADPNKKSARTFQCRDVLWDSFEQMARELECSVDYLVNEAMKHYLRQRSQGSVRTPYPGSKSEVSPAMGHPAAPPPIPGPLPSVPIKPPTGGSRAPAAMPLPPPPSRMPPPPGRGAPAPMMPLAGAAPAPQVSRAPTAPPPIPQPLGAPPPIPHAPGSMAPPPIPQVSRPVAMPGASPQARPGAPPPVASPGGRAAPHQEPSRVNGRAAPAAGGTLTLVYNGERFPITKDRFVIGRGKQSSDLTLKDPNVSRQHAVVEFQAGTYFMVDMGSTNGVSFNGQRIARRPIGDGDLFKICDHDLLFTYR